MYDNYFDGIELCKICKSKFLKIENVFSKILTFEVEPIRLGRSNKIQIRNITNEIKMKHRTYTLFAVNEHQVSIKHFRAHIKRQNSWHIFDDLNIQATSVRILIEKRYITVYNYNLNESTVAPVYLIKKLSCFY